MTEREIGKPEHESQGEESRISPRLRKAEGVINSRENQKIREGVAEKIERFYVSPSSVGFIPSSLLTASCCESMKLDL